MRAGGRVAALAILAATLTTTTPAAGQADGLDARLRVFLEAPDRIAALAAARELVVADASVSQVYARLRAGRSYAHDVPTGRLDRVRTAPDGRQFPYTLLIPAGYDPARSYPAVVYLHGGVNRSEWEPGGEWWRDYDRIADEDRIVIVPASWSAARWWQEAQSDNLAEILAGVKRLYNVDENRVFLIGISDGGTGAYYQAFRRTTPWAGFLAFIGHPAVLSSPRIGADGLMFVPNLRNKPLFIVNGGQDRLYPTASIEPYVELFRRSGVELVYRPQPESGHDMRWLPAEAARIDSFIAATVRTPLPDRISWETERVDHDNRAHWVVIDELGAVAGESELEPLNTLPFAKARDGSPIDAFRRGAPSGRIEIEKRGNEVEVRTRGVRRYTLLISPESFDLDRPVLVRSNGRESFRGRVSPDLEFLLERAAIDSDRTMLFAAALTIDLRQAVR